MSKKGIRIGKLVWVFLVFGVLQSPLHAEELSFGVIGDAGRRVATTDLTRASMAKSNVRELILPGDNLYGEETSYSHVWHPWFDQGFSFPVVAIGNHTLNYAAEVSFFKMPAEFYSKRFGKALFIVLNSDNDKTAKDQALFLERELAASNDPLVFIVQHHPPYTISQTHSWTERPNFQGAIRPILTRYKKKISAILVGHDHLASVIEADGLAMVISGAAFEQRSSNPVDYHAEDGALVKTRWLYRGHPHWARLDIDDAFSKVWVNFVDATNDQVDCSVQVYPRPLVMRPNCAQSASRLPAIDPLRLPIQPENDD